MVPEIENNPPFAEENVRVLSDEERRRGFVRPMRTLYVHNTCGAETALSTYIAEQYAADPEHYIATYCTTCHGHFPAIEFVWAGTTEAVGS